MKTMFSYGFILAAICAIAGGLLAGVNTLTKPFIIRQAYAQERSALEELYPSAASFEAVKDGDAVVYYKALDRHGAFLGAVFKAAGKGYAGPVETMAAMDASGKLLGIKVVSQNETPGLGTLVTQAPFTSKFKGRNAAELDSVEAIAGATISSRAVINAVQAQALKVKELMADGS